MVSFVQTIHWVCGNKKAASVAEGRSRGLNCYYGFGFACGAGVGGVGLAWLAAASTIVRAFL